MVYPFVLFPDGLTGNPPAADQPWQANLILKNGVLGKTAETQTPTAPGVSPNDRYAIQLNYWNSVTSNSSIGYSTGNSCVLFYYNQGNIGQFTITYPAGQAAPRIPEVSWAAAHPTSFPWYGNAPYSLGAADGSPTGYVSTFKGCSWDANSCTQGSAVLTAASPNPATPQTDINVFPQKLSAITSIPSTWNISYDHTYGDPEIKNGNHIWDASYDIWFDRTGQTGVGQGACPGCSGRGQNDGLEIMVWMNSNHSYVDNASGGQFAVPNGSGFAEPSGFPREQVIINRVLYDVWTARLDNPYFGYPAATGNTILAAGAEPYTCPTLPGAVCGTEWNVVSFVATIDNSGHDYRATGMTMDTKVFTDYILGIPDGLWSYPAASRYPATAGNPSRIATGTPSGVLACPASSIPNQQGALSTYATAACLDQNWFLTSVEAGFEPWLGGNGLVSQSFQAHVETSSTAVQSGIINGIGNATVNWTQPFDVVYSGCASNVSPNTASFTISGINSQTGAPMVYPLSNVPIPMTPALGSPNLFVSLVNAPGATLLYPMHGNATINYTATCGGVTTTSSVPIFIDPSGQVFYSDGATPAAGATVTLLYSPSGSASGPFVAVPNQNFGLTNAVMQPDDNILNPMPSTQYGAYAWNVAPGYYQVNAELAGCGSVSSPIQHVVSTPITNLYLDLPCAPPASLVPTPNIPGPPHTLTATAVSSSQIDLNWGAVPLPAGASALSHTVYALSTSATAIVSGLTGTSYSVTGLNPNTSYTFAVTAADTTGASVPSPPATATTQAIAIGKCHVGYHLTSATPGVTNGLTAYLDIQNTGATAIYPWTLSWTFPGNQKITYAWNVTESQNGANVSLVSTAPWESIPAGGTLSGAVGFNGGYTGTNTNPTAFYLNGLLCQ